MNAEVGPLRLDTLPKTVEELAGQVPRTAVQLLRISMNPQAPAFQVPGEVLVLGELRFRWRLYLAKKGERVVFFFFRKQAPVRVVLDTDITFAIRPAPRTEAAPPARLDRVDFRVVLPPFVTAQPSERKVKELGPPGANPQNTVVLALGPGTGDVLAVKDPEKGAHGAQLRCTHAGTEVILRGADGKWRLGPFLSFIEAIRSWVGRDFEDGETVPLDLYGQDGVSEPRRILNLLALSYVRACHVLGTARLEVPPILGSLMTDYGVSGYRARILLRLKADGMLASEDRDDPFQLMMTARLWTTDGRVEAKVAVGPPDFIVSGPLHGAFLDALADGDVLHDLEEQNVGLSQAQTGCLLRRHRDKASVFRVKREQTRDTDIVVLQGVWEGRHRMLVLRGAFEVYAKEDPPRVVPKRGSIGVLFHGDPNPDSFGFDDGFVTYFLRLIAAVKDWVGVLG